MRYTHLFIILALLLPGCRHSKTGTHYVFYKADCQRTGWFKTKGVKELHKVKWTFNASEILTTPIIYRNMVIITKTNGLIYFVDIETGEPLGYLNLAFYSNTPAIRNDTLFIPSIGALYVFAFDTNNLKWVCDVDGVENPIIYKDRIFLQTRDSICAVKFGIWQKVWTFPGETGVFSSMAMDSSLLFLTIVDKYRRYAKLCCIDASTGKALWLQKKECASETPAVADGMVFMGGKDRFFYAFDEWTGKIIWKFDAGSEITTSAAVTSDAVYFGCINKNLYCLDIHTGKKKWVFHGPAEITCDPVYADGIVYFACMHKFFALDAQTGKVLWTFDAGSFIKASPLVHEGVVYVGSVNGILYALM